MHKHKVSETKTRSLLKAVTARVLEVFVDTLLLGTIYSFFGIHSPYELALGLSVLIEFLCAVATYINERLWNKIQWGREVEDVYEDRTKDS